MTEKEKKEAQALSEELAKRIQYMDIEDRLLTTTRKNFMRYQDQNELAELAGIAKHYQKAAMHRANAEKWKRVVIEIWDSLYPSQDCTIRKIKMVLSKWQYEVIERIPA